MRAHGSISTLRLAGLHVQQKPGSQHAVSAGFGSLLVSNVASIARFSTRYPVN